MLPKNNPNHNIYIITKICFALFIIILINLAYIQVYNASNLTNNPYNNHSSMQMEKIQRGSIYDCNNTVLAYSEYDDYTKSFHRYYPWANAYANTIGYVSEKLGYAGIEAKFNSYLAGNNSIWHYLGPISQLFQQTKGDDIVLTIDHNYQEAALNALGNRRGAVVILNRKTGAVLAMVSSPNFNPNTIDSDWDELRQASDSPLLNRATQGLYPPGSSIKPLIANGGLSQGEITPDTIIDCKGYIEFPDHSRLRDNDGEVHGPISLLHAMEESCNVYFGTVGMKLGGSGLDKAFNDFGMDKKLDTDFDESLPHLPRWNKLTQGDLAQAGIGQASLLETPLRMAMVAAAVGNGGISMKPYIVQKILNADGKTIEEYKPTEFAKAMTPQNASTIYDAMAAVVHSGTGTAAYIPGIDIIGKTGTAENQTSRPHAWFIGCANMPHEDIAFAVIVENGGYGGSVAAPIIKQILRNILVKEGK